MAETTNLITKNDHDIPDTSATASVVQKRAAMQEIRDLLADLDGNSIDLDQMRAEKIHNPKQP